jgi:hypothetical protein
LIGGADLKQIPSGLHTDVWMVLCQCRGSLPSTQQWTGIDGRQLPRGEKPRCPLRLFPPPGAEPEAGQAAVENIGGVVDLGVADDEDGSTTRSMKGD